VTACANGCTVRGEHRSDCSTTGCAGCQARMAEYGVLCTPCHGRLTRDLWQAPDLVAYLRGLVGDGGGGGERVDGTREAPMPLNGPAVDGADDLHAMLASWVRVVLDEHPGRLVGPDPAGTRFTSASKRRVTGDAWFVACADCTHPGRRATQAAAVAAAGEHVDATSHVVTAYEVDPGQVWARTVYATPVAAGLLPRTGAHAATIAVARWLLAQLEWIERQPWVTVMLAEVGPMVATMRARFPQEEASHRIDGVACLACGRMPLTYYPPVAPAPFGEFMVQCDHHECSAIIPEKHWGLYLRRIVDELGPRPQVPHVPKKVGHSSEGYGGAA
jgi:hypothetical protein